MDSLRRFLYAKIHGATITHSNVKYEGSISIPPSLLEGSRIAESEAVWVWDVTNGARFETYVIAGEDEGVISVNGAAARLVQVGDKVIIAAFCLLAADKIAQHQPHVVFVDSQNQITEKRSEVPGPGLKAGSVPVKLGFG